jgi:hypothetical protein
VHPVRGRHQDTHNWIVRLRWYVSSLGEFGRTAIADNPNAAFNATSVTPSSGVWSGGYAVTITGHYLSLSSDISNMTLVGSAVAAVLSQSMSHIVVTAGPGVAVGTGPVVAVSTLYGAFSIPGATFEYLTRAYR